MVEDCTAIILAGGDSHRMGRDKAILEFAGQTLIQSVLDTVQPLFPTTIVSVRRARPEINLPQVCDTEESGGPLTGLVSALAQVTTPWVFVVGCDMPFVSPDLIKLLATNRAEYQAVVPVAHGRAQPLLAFYSSTCLTAMRANLASGDKSLLGLLKRLSVCYVGEGELLGVDPQLRSFFDLDTPQDVAIAQGFK